MDVIVANSNREDSSYLTDADLIDIEIGGSNDFEITLPLNEADRAGLEIGAYIYVADTEYGGIVEEIRSATNDSIVTYGGTTWRGLLDKSVIEPPSGQDYRVVSGDIRAVLRSLVNGAADVCATFAVPTGNVGASVSNYQIDRYVTTLAAIEKMLTGVGYRIDLHVKAGYNFEVILDAVPITDYSQTEEYSQDNPARGGIAVTRYEGGVNHLICLGQGDLKDRTVVHLYVMEDGSIQQDGTPFYTGEAMRTAVYDYSSAKDVTELVTGGRERLEELRSRSSFELEEYEDRDYPIGDVIGGRDFKTGIFASSAVTGKILRIEAGGTPEISTSIGKISAGGDRFSGGESSVQSPSNPDSSFWYLKPGSNGIVINKSAIGGPYTWTAPKNGYVLLFNNDGFKLGSVGRLDIDGDMREIYYIDATTSGSIGGWIPVKAGQVVSLYIQYVASPWLIKFAEAASVAAPNYVGLYDYGTSGNYVWEKWIMPNGTKLWKGEFSQSLQVASIPAASWGGGQLTIYSDIPPGVTISSIRNISSNDRNQGIRILVAIYSSGSCSIHNTSAGATPAGPMIISATVRGTWA